MNNSQNNTTTAGEATSVGLNLIHKIDTLGDAEDRLMALLLMTEGIAGRQEASAFNRIAGDVLELVTEVRDALNDEHERAQHNEPFAPAHAGTCSTPAAR